MTCHNDRIKTAGLTLASLDLARVGEHPEVWEKVVGKLRSAAMPPVGRPRPSRDEAAQFATYLEDALDRAAKPTAGGPAVRRLNRTEYANAVRDLLNLDIDGATLLPADDAAFGFDTIGDLLTVSPVLFERYLAAARKIARLAVGDPTIGPSTATYEVSPEYGQHFERMSEDLPFASRGGIGIHHFFPLSGEYDLEIHAIGRASPKTLEVRLDGQRVAEIQAAGAGTDVPGQSSPSKGIEHARIVASAGPHVLAVSFVATPKVAEGVAPSLYPMGRVNEIVVDNVRITGPHNPTGPGDTPSRRRIFSCVPAAPTDEQPCAARIMTALARQAYRRPVTKDDVQTLLGFYESGRGERGFEAGIQAALERLLVSPDFLFRIERTPSSAAPGSLVRVSDIELASRLSFFLWSSAPDAQLLRVAEAGQLNKPDVLEREVRRMLGDPRATALVTNFASEWLYLRNVKKAQPDRTLFPDFDANLRDALQRETELFLESQMRDDRGLLELLSADYTFLNERLARHYGIPDVYGSHFRRVHLDERYHRGGLLGQGSIQIVTSYAHRTSPVLRGKWVLENILGAPPPPPPPNVPDLPDGNSRDRPRSVREQLEIHRANPACASCHARMDPLGFAFDNFDPVGRWRTQEGGTPVDASGVLPDGAKIDGLAGLRDALIERGDQFVSTVTNKLLTYALGRGIDTADAPAVRKIVRDARADHYRWSSIILGIVRSQPFQLKRAAA